MLYVLASVLAKIFIGWPVSCQGYLFAYRWFAIYLESGSFDWRVILAHTDLSIHHIDHIRFFIHTKDFPGTYTTVAKSPFGLFQIGTTCLLDLIIVLLSIVEFVICIQYSTTLLRIFPWLQSWHARCPIQVLLHDTFGLFVKYVGTLGWFLWNSAWFRFEAAWITYDVVLGETVSWLITRLSRVCCICLTVEHRDLLIKDSIDALVLMGHGSCRCRWLDWGQGRFRPFVPADGLFLVFDNSNAIELCNLV